MKELKFYSHNSIELIELINKLIKVKVESFYEINNNQINELLIELRKNDLEIFVMDKRGFNVLKNNFFVDELCSSNKFKKETKIFDDFERFYTYINGEIYESSCYFGYTFTNKDILEYHIDISKINFISFTSKQISQDSYAKYLQSKRENNDEYVVVKNIKKWIEKYKLPSNFKKFLSDYEKFVKNNNIIYVEKIFFSVVFNKFGENIKDFYIRYFCENGFPPHTNIIDIIVWFGLDSAQCIKSNYSNKFIDVRTYKKDIEKIENGINYYLENKEKLEISGEYCIDNNLYTCYLTINNSSNYFLNDKIFFLKLEDLGKFLNNNLQNIDLRTAIIDENELEKYIISETTLLPYDPQEINLEVTKKYEKGFFEVILEWYDNNMNLIDSLRRKFKFLCDFVYYLENDISFSNLTMCDGLENVDLSKFKINNIIVRSNVALKNNIPIKKIEIDDKNKLVFEHSMELEKKYDIVYMDKHEIEDINDKNMHEIFYISDLHLLHKFNNISCKTKEDFIYVLNKIYENYEKAKTLNDFLFPTLLIAGDISSSFQANNYFLFNFIERNRLLNIFYTLGNHELWGYKNKDLKYVLNLYENCNNNCHLVHNNIYYFEENRSIYSSQVNKISEEELVNINVSELRNKLRKARLIIFGGIGFSGKNKTFNALNGIYDGLITREEEIIESEKFDKLYRKVTLALYDKNVIILTHMPFEDWSSEKSRNNGFVYVSGHNHKNTFYDDGAIRIYSDNQVGYTSKSIQFKSFGINKTYDFFSDYSDGIYEISKEDYISFIKGKNIQMSFKRDLNIFMLKKNEHYCFLTKNSKNEIGIFNGGSYTNIGKNDLNYYFDNMDKIISIINEPLTKYRELQTKISNEVKKWGGDGTIHGCIIDIDFFNHIFVNPLDGRVTPYYALDMIYKIVYESVSKLLEERRPDLYINYIDTVKKENSLCLKFNTEISRTSFLYQNTDIYKASRIIKKMQRLSQNILTLWDDNYLINKKILK